MTKANKEHPFHLQRLTWLLTHRALFNRAQYHKDVSALNELTRLTQMLTVITKIFLKIMTELVNVNSIKFSLTKDQHGISSNA